MTLTNLTPMTSRPAPESPALHNAPAVFRTAVRICADNWRHGTLTWVLPDGTEAPCRGTEPGPDARLIIRDYRFIRRCLAAGSIGFAEGYMAEEWDTPDLSALLTAFALWRFTVTCFLLRKDRLEAAIDSLSDVLRKWRRRIFPWRC